MRIRNAVLVIVIALAGATSISITGQEEPLPVVRPKGSADVSAPIGESAWRGEPTVYLAADPIRELPPLTLAQAARNNDYISFHELFVAAQNRGEDVSSFAALHELWSWSMSDPIGAFYGAAIHDRLARAYPGYASYIDEFRLVDRNGNAFYPTAETRVFLLERATRGEVSRVIIARAEEKPAPAAARRPARTKPARRTAARVAAPTPAEPVRKTAPPVTVASPSPAASQLPSPAGQRPAEGQSEGIAQPVQQPAPVVQQQQTPAPAPVVAEPEPQTRPAATQSNDLRNRGILLLIIGLLGTGILAVILRAPKEQPHSIINPADKVHPIRKPATPVPPSTPSTPPADEHRATGSHG